MIKLVASGLFSYSKHPTRENQDTILSPQYIESGYLLAVADGVGSYVGAQNASQSAIHELAGLVDKYSVKNTQTIFMSLRESISRLSATNDEFSEAATTLTFCFINSDGLYVGHVGDCRLYLKRGNKLVQLTKDHTQHQKLLDEKIFNRSELRHLGGKNTLTTAISKSIPLDYQELFLPINEVIDDNGEISVFIMSDGAYHFWDKRPRFSLNTLNNPNSFSASLYKRIQRATPIDDHSLIAAKFLVS